MKTKLHLCAFMSFALAVTAFDASLSSAYAQGSAFTYQGQLTTGTAPANGTYDFKFDLFPLASGGAVIGGPVTNLSVIVSNGLFTALVDFGTNVFTGGSNWLHIQVRTNGATGFSNLLPRQQVTPTPYAIFAEGANASGLTGTIPASGLTGVNGSGLISVNANTLNGVGNNYFWQTIGNAGTSPGVNFLGTLDNQSLYLDVFDKPALKLSTNSSMAMGNCVLANSLGLSYEVALGNGSQATGNGSVAIGWVSSSTGPGSVAIGESVVSSGDDSFASGGASQATAQDATAMGSLTVASGLYSMAVGYHAQALHEGSFVWADDSGGNFQSRGTDEFLIRAQGGVGINTTLAAPQADLSVHGGQNIDQANNNAGFFNNSATNGYCLGFGSNSGEGVASQRQPGFASNQYGLDFYTDFTHRMSITQGGLVGIGTGTNAPNSALEVADGSIRTDGSALFCASTSISVLANDGLYNGSFGLSGLNNNDGPGLWGYYGGSLGALNPNVIALSWDSGGDVQVNQQLTVGGEYVVVNGLTPVKAYLGDDGVGKDVQIGSQVSGITAVSCYNSVDKAYMHLYCSSITIEGGSDLAEPFKITAANDEVPQGAVVVIDEANPGHLKISNQSYDTHVAGVVSGANGINPGIQMQQQGLLDGGKNVALTGRVYVQADTSNGAIKPGDLLTTSSIPGRAMKVSDHARAAGAILGKAMTGLSTGRGMVLVLVTLQ